MEQGRTGLNHLPMCCQTNSRDEENQGIQSDMTSHGNSEEPHMSSESDHLSTKFYTDGTLSLSSTIDIPCFISGSSIIPIVIILILLLLLLLLSEKTV